MPKARKKTAEDYIRSPTADCRQWVEKRLKHQDEYSFGDDRVKQRLTREWFAIQQGY